MCQCTLISCSKCTPVVGGIVGVGHCVCVGIGGMWKLYVLSTQLCHECKISLKNRTFKKSTGNVDFLEWLCDFAGLMFTSF